MNPIIEEFTLTLKYQVRVDTETGEMTTQCISRQVDKTNFEVVEAKQKRAAKPKLEESTVPTLVLEDNKYLLNQAAIQLMQVAPDDKLDIRYEKRGTTVVPIIGTNIAFNSLEGNRITKSFTVAYRGSKNEELRKYGTRFTIIPHKTKENLFELVSDTKIETEEVEEDIMSDLQDLIDDKDANITEVSPSMFQL